MYRILIVDDEAVEREVIRFLLHKYDFPFAISEAANGRDALALLENQHFDVLFTDIRMPFMDGLELAEQARRMDPHMQIVFFSGYDDFEYAKRALSLRIVNYILKPINPEEFQKTISEVLTQINTYEEQIREQSAARDFMRSHIVHQLIAGIRPKQLKSHFPQWDFSFLEEYHRLFLIQLEGDFFNPQSQEADILFSHADLQKLLPPDCDCINLDPAQYLILFYGRKHHFKWYQELADRIVSRVRKICRMNCYIAISTSFQGTDQLSRAYTEAEQSLLDRFFFSGSSTFGNEVMQTPDPSAESDDFLLQQLRATIQFKDNISLKKYMPLLLSRYQCQNRSHIYTRFLCTTVLKLLLDSLPSSTPETFDTYAKHIQTLNHFSEIESILLQLTDQVCAELAKKQLPQKHAIMLAKQYIHSHYDSDLSLDILAEKIHLSPRYLSSLFIEEVGIGINRYIKNVRMQKAQELLLETNLKVSDICTKVGYSNLSYFCKTFLEAFGTTPDKFRHGHSSPE